MPEIQVPVKEFQPHKWGLDFLRTFDSRLARFFMLCWHRRARKTTHTLNLLIREAIRNPKKVYGYIAPTYVQGKSIVWRDPNMLKRYLPMEHVKNMNESELFVEFKNKSILAIKGSDKPDSIRGMDFEGVALDEFPLMKRAIWEEILRPIITQNKNRWAAFTFTPKGINHAHEYWQNALHWEGWYRSMLKASESNLLPADELKQAKIEMPGALYEQEMECSFVAREEKSLITSEMLEALEVVQLVSPEIKKLIACDPSEGGDECVIKAFKNTQCVEQRILHENDTMKIAGEMMLMAAQYGTINHAVDSIGVGSGIASRLRELKQNVIAIQSAEKANEPERFYNKRTEMWWYVSDLIRQKMHEPIGDHETKRQLVAPKYEVIDSNGKVKVEPKRYTKDILGRSPDRGDCHVYGIWALQYVDADGSKPEKSYNYRKRTMQSTAPRRMTSMTERVPVQMR